MKKTLSALLLLLTCLMIPATASAKVGVGVGTGKINISEGIKSGSIYTLPAISVFNTGDEEATYTMAVTLNEVQDELKPNPNWFTFSPAVFKLPPGGAQTVIPTFHPPIRTQPGDYFGYLEAHPAETATQGGAVVGVAAATKLSFNVIPSNIFTASMYRLLALYHQYEPWSKIGLFLIPVVLFLLILNRFINLRAAFGGAWKAGRTKPEKKDKKAKKE